MNSISTHPLTQPYGTMGSAHTIISIPDSEETERQPLLTQIQTEQQSLWESTEPRSQTEVNNVFAKCCIILGGTASCLAGLLFLGSDTPIVTPLLLVPIIAFIILPSYKIMAAEERAEIQEPVARHAQTPITPNNNSRRPDLSQEEPAIPENLELSYVGKGKMVARENSTPSSMA